MADKIKILKTKASIKKYLKDFLSNKDSVKSCYFWSSSGKSKSYRERLEKKYSMPPVQFAYKDKIYYMSANMTVSTSRYYYNEHLKIDGVSKNITPFRKVLKELESNRRVK